jgi:hypothetical protein
MTASGEVKATRSKVKLRWFGLFVVLLGRLTTGASFSASRYHNIEQLDHSVPLCTTSYP